MAVDHTLKAVVLSIRGTYSLADAVTNCLCNDAPFLGGMAHDGFLAFARELVAVAEETIAELCRQYPSYTCAVTGHSLGGGVATLTALLLRENQQGRPSQAGPSGAAAEAATGPAPLEGPVAGEDAAAAGTPVPPGTRIECYAWAPGTVFAPIEQLPQVRGRKVECQAPSDFE